MIKEDIVDLADGRAVRIVNCGSPDIMNVLGNATVS
jgi:hypothetical protein